MEIFDGITLRFRQFSDFLHKGALSHTGAALKYEETFETVEIEYIVKETYKALVCVAPGETVFKCHALTPPDIFSFSLFRKQYFVALFLK